MVPVLSRQSARRLAAVAGGGGGGSYAFVASVSAGSADAHNVTTGTVNTTGADLLVVAVASYGVSSTPTVSDNKSNTWTPLTSYSTTSGNAERLTLFYAKNATCGTGHTFSASESSGTPYPAISMAAFSGSDLTSPADQQTGTSTEGANTVSPGSITPSVNGELVVSGLCLGSIPSSGPSVGSGFTIASGTPSAGGLNFGVSLAYLIQTSAAAANPAWTFAGATALAAIASFKTP